MSTPKTTPAPSLAWEFGILPIEYRILTRKLCLAKHILSLKSDSLAKEIFITQNEMSFPGLANEIEQLINDLKLPKAWLFI